MPSRRTRFCTADWIRYPCSGVMYAGVAEGAGRSACSMRSNRAFEVERLGARETHREDREAHPVASDGTLCARADFHVFGPLRKIARCFELRLLFDNGGNCANNVAVLFAKVVSNGAAGRDGATFDDIEGVLIDEFRHFCLLLRFMDLVAASYGGRARLCGVGNTAQQVTAARRRPQASPRRRRNMPTNLWRCSTRMKKAA